VCVCVCVCVCVVQKNIKFYIFSKIKNSFSDLYISLKKGPQI